MKLEVVILLLNSASSQDLFDQSEILEIDNSSSWPSGGLNWISIGDYGFKGRTGQKLVAAQMDLIAGQESIDFILGLGDNFYEPDGIKSADDDAWNTHWANIYQSLPNLSKLTWYGVLGNHDYNNDGLMAELQYC